jgi:hypothetical protein
MTVQHLSLRELAFSYLTEAAVYVDFVMREEVEVQ